jgi:hypothetical protein
VPVWWTPQVYRFIAASNQRIYATDKVGRLRVLNAQTGAWLDTIDTRNLPIKLVNSDTDRLYLASDTGLLQCLHEQELVEPLQHRARTSAPAQEPEPEG